MQKILSLALSISILFNVSAQTEIEEGQALLKSYISPLAISLGTALNNGWYNTAKPHKLGGFDVTFTTNFVLIPDESKTFNINQVAGVHFTGENTPTILGTGNGSNITYNGSENEMPKGLGIPIVPVPMLQAGVGLVKNSEINIRYIPEIKIGNAGKIGLFGIGAKHDVLQWLPIVDKIPLTVSIQAGYTKLKSEIQITDANNSDYNTNLNLSSTTFNLVLSKKLLMFTPYFGIGYNSTQTNFNVNGAYNIGGLNIPLQDLTSLEIENNNEPRINVGFRFNITVLALQANYTFSKYPVATLGAGISLR